MSRENVEIAARWYEPATSKAELLRAMPRTMAFCHPEVEAILIERFLDIGVRKIPDLVLNELQDEINLFKFAR
jgi:hypothetical protein